MFLNTKLEGFSLLYCTKTAVIKALNVVQMNSFYSGIIIITPASLRIFVKPIEFSLCVKFAI